MISTGLLAAVAGLTMVISSNRTTISKWITTIDSKFMAIVSKIMTINGRITGIESKFMANDDRMMDSDSLTATTTVGMSANALICRSVAGPPETQVNSPDGYRISFISTSMHSAFRLIPYLCT